MRTSSLGSCLGIALLAVFCGGSSASGQQPRPTLEAWTHGLILHATPEDFSGATTTNGQVGKTGVVLEVEGGGAASLESGDVVPADPFTDVLLSGNVAVPDGAGFRLELQVRPSGSEDWSPWLVVLEWGDVPKSESRPTSAPSGMVDVDYFRSQTLHDRLRNRVRAFAAPQKRRTVRVERIGMATGRRRSDLEFDSGSENPIDEARARRRLDVPYRSQTWEDRDVAGHVCSPTSVAMVLAYRGVNLATMDVARRIKDDVAGIFGNWPRAVQAAYTFGVPGWLRRFSKWSEVEACIVEGQPVIVSIGVRAGELTGAPYRATAGHLIVLTGFTDDGRVHVNDPAAKDAATGRLTYSRAELDKVWLSRGGTAYVLGRKVR